MNESEPRRRSSQALSRAKSADWQRSLADEEKFDAENPLSGLPRFVTFKKAQKFQKLRAHWQRQKEYLAYESSADVIERYDRSSVNWSGQRVEPLEET